MYKGQWLFIFVLLRIAVVQLLSCVRLFATLWTIAHQASLSFVISWSLLKLMYLESVMSSNHLIFCFPFLFLPSNFLSIKGFSNDSAFCIRWPKYWSLSMNSFNEYSGIISFKIDWFILLAIQGALKSLLQHHSLKASLLLSIFMTQLSPYLLRVLSQQMNKKYLLYF